VPMYQ